MSFESGAAATGADTRSRVTVNVDVQPPAAGARVTQWLQAMVDSKANSICPIRIDSTAPARDDNRLVFRATPDEKARGEWSVRVSLGDAVGRRRDDKLWTAQAAAGRFDEHSILRALLNRAIATMDTNESGQNPSSRTRAATQSTGRLPPPAAAVVGSAARPSIGARKRQVHIGVLIHRSFANDAYPDLKCEDVTNKAIEVLATRDIDATATTVHEGVGGTTQTAAQRAVDVNLVYFMNGADRVDFNSIARVARQCLDPKKPTILAICRRNEAESKTMSRISTAGKEEMGDLVVTDVLLYFKSTGFIAQKMGEFNKGAIAGIAAKVAEYAK
jgi:hypothetical protein